MLMLRRLFTHPRAADCRTCFKALILFYTLIIALKFSFCIYFSSFTNFWRFSISWQRTRGRFSSSGAFSSSYHIRLLSLFLCYQLRKPAPRWSLATVGEAAAAPKLSLEPAIQVLTLRLCFGKASLEDQLSLSVGTQRTDVDAVIVLLFGSEPHGRSRSWAHRREALSRRGGRWVAPAGLWWCRALSCSLLEPQSSWRPCQG